MVITRSRGFTQLAVELIALTQVENHAVWYGAVTMGDVGDLAHWKLLETWSRKTLLSTECPMTWNNSPGF
jgi:hypothetical protein